MAEVTGMTPDKIAQEITNVKSYVDGGLSEKADKSQVTSDLSKKADKTQVASDLYKKADITYVDSLSPLKSFAGTGSPEGKVAAPVGSIYTDTAATTGAILWIKSSGAGGTGWKIQWGDTGWRTIAPTPEGTIRSGTGKILVKRENQRVIWRFGDLGITDGAGAAIIISSSEFPSGFYPYLSGSVFHVSHRTGSTFISKLKIVSSLYWIGLDSGTNLSQTRTNVELRGEISYTTDDPWPATLPGTPA